MSDESPQTVPDQPPLPGVDAGKPDPTQIDAHQDRLARQAAVAVREQYARQCLAVFAPEPGDGTLSYVEVLQRLQAAITQEVEEQQRHVSDR